MRNRLITLGMAAAFVFAACGGGGSSRAPTGPAGTGPAGTTPAGTTAAFDPSTVTGEVTLGAWESSPAEGLALKAALDAFAVAYPNIKVTQEPIAGDYRRRWPPSSARATSRTCSTSTPSTRPTGSRSSFLEPLDPYIAKRATTPATFFEGYLDTFKGPDGKIYGLPKDGNTIAMAYNTDCVTDAADHPATSWSRPPTRSRATASSRRRCA